MAFSYNKKNLANTTISGSLSASATSVTVNDASVFPVGYFYATLMPSSEISSFNNSEIVLVTNISDNILTIARAQNGTTARAFNDGSIITNGIYTQDMDMAQAVGKKIFDANWDSEAGYYKINDPMLKIVPDEGTSIRVVFDTDVSSGASAALSINENTQSGTATKIGKNIEIRDANALPPVSIGLNGDTEQKTFSGKNLLSNIGYGLSNGLTSVSNSDGSITITGKTTSTSANITTRSTIAGLPAGTYTFSLQENAPFRLNLAGTYPGESRESLGYIPAGNKKITITTTKTLVELDLWATVPNGADIDATIYPQFEAGSDATSFEPYVGSTASPNPDYPQEVKVVSGEQTITFSDGGSQSQEYTVELAGKNLFDRNNAHTFGGYIDGISHEIVTGSKVQDSLWINIEPNTTYTLSKMVTARFAIGTATSYENGTICSTYAQDNSAESLTITSGANDKYLIAFIRNDATSATLAEVLDTVQLEKGSTATTYEAYWAYELCKIGTYQDYIYKSGDDWYIHKETTKYTITGTENWGLASSNPNLYYTPDVLPTPAGATYPAGYCNHFSFVTRYPNQNNNEIAVRNNTGAALMARCDSVADVSAFKTWLQNNRTVIYYSIDTSTDTQITNAGLIAQLEELASTALYEGQNNITVSGDLAGYLNLTYNTINSGVYVANIVNGAYILDDNTREPAPAKAGLPYDLTYHNGNWYIMNMIGEVALPDGSVTTGKIADNAVNGDKIADDTITNGKIADTTINSGKINLTTFPRMSLNWQSNSGTYNKSIDISAIPTGAKFAVIASGFINLGAGGNIEYRLRYNNTNTTSHWADNKGNGNAAIPITESCMFTKVAGANSIIFELAHGTYINDSAFNMMVIC